MPSILLVTLAIATAAPATTEPNQSGQDAQQSWTDAHGTWTALPDPDPEGIVKPVPGLGETPRQPRRKASASFDRERRDAEGRVDEALRRAGEAVARAGEAVRNAEDR